jgi:hypothetical protein
MGTVGAIAISVGLIHRPLRQAKATEVRLGGIMNLKRILTTLAIAGMITGSTAFSNASVASAQYRDRYGRSWYEGNRHRDELERIRRYDYQRRLRYRMSGPTRIVGYYDRFGRFHAYGFYDRFGRFHRY